MATLTPDEVAHIARLARLSLSEDETRQYAEELSAVFSLMEQLNEVDTSGVSPTVQVTGLINVTRRDEIHSTNTEIRDKLVAAFPEHVGPLLSVNEVFANQK